MNICPCPADRTRALARLRKGRADLVERRNANEIEVKMSCGCVLVVDFNEPGLSAVLERWLVNRIK